MNKEAVKDIMEQEDSSKKKKASLKRKLPSESAPEKKRKSREGSNQNGSGEGEGDEEDSTPEEHPQKKTKKTKKQKTDQGESASLDEEALRLPLASTDGLLKTSKQFYAAKDKIDHVEEDVDNEDKIPLAVKSRKYVPTKGFSHLCLSHFLIY